MAGELGIALGLANAYLKRCIKKGLIKATGAPAKRYAYYLTPQGFAEKSRLTAEYLSISFNFFREARRQCGDLFESCTAKGHKTVLLCGTGDLVEIAVLCVSAQSIKLVGVVESAHNDGSSAGLPVFADFQHAPPADAVVVTDMVRPQETYDAIVAAWPERDVLAPRFLNITRRRCD